MALVFRNTEDDSATPVNQQSISKTRSGALPFDANSEFVYEHDIPSSDYQDQAKEDTRTPVHGQTNGYKPFVQRSAPVNDDKKDRWMPVLISAFMFNLFLWVSLIYAITRIDTDRSNRARYLATTLSMFLVPSVLTSALVYSLTFNFNLRHQATGILRRLKSLANSRHYLPTIYALNAWCCLILVIVYFFGSALPQYRQLHWQNSVTGQMNTFIPSFAIIDGLRLASPNQVPLQVSCNLTRSGDTRPCEEAVSFTPDNESRFRHWLFDATKLPGSPASLNYVGDYLVVTLWIKHLLNGTNATTFDPFLSGAMSFLVFDPRLSLPVGCNNVDFLPLFSAAVYSAHYTITQITDLYGFEHDRCTPQTSDLYQNTSAPFLSYTTIFGASVVSRNVTDCLISDDGEEVLCAFSLILQSGAQTAQTRISAPGISKVDVALNAGSIVGGAQFFFWFFTTLIPTRFRSQ